jgi:adenylate cyclase
MLERRRRLPPAILAGVCAGLAVALAGLFQPATWRERVFDAMLAAVAHVRPVDASQPFVLVDIDTASLSAIGPWPWRREVLATLVSAIAKGEPAAIALDILLAEPDSRSPAALARSLAAETGRADLGALALTLVDGDKALAEALALTPVALGYVLDPRGRTGMPETPILSRDGATFGTLWSSAGATGPAGDLAQAATGHGVLSLPGDGDGLVRRAPLMASIAGAVRPGLALEALRLAQGASAYLVAGDPARLSVGPLDRPLTRDGMLRLAPLPHGSRPKTLSAATLLDGRADASALKDATVFVGGSAAELGGLRASPSGPLVSSARIQLDAARQFAAGIVPLRPAYAGTLEFGLGTALSGLAILLARRLRPLQAGATLAAGCALLVIAALAAAAGDRLHDPSLPLVAAISTFLVTALWTFSEARLREARLRRRFEQHLAPGVVERIVADPTSLKLSGERRVVTAMFTDIEGFTAMTRRIEPEALVAVLDGYFGGVTAIVVAHGGTVDKFVGDAVHALFNAPLDLPEHPRRAVACAVALLAWTEAYRRERLASAAGLGRTRIGLETGPVIVGDVGFGEKLDYTAHGDAVNTASRLEALNKKLGSSICIGPAAAALCTPGEVRLLARAEIAGLGELEVFTPSNYPP